MRTALYFIGVIFLSSCSREKIDNVQVADTVRFFVLGDWGRNGTNNQLELAEAMEQLASRRPADFFLSLGDNFYPVGVSSTSDPQWNNSFEDIYTGPHLKIPWYVALGNHDYYGNPTAEIEYTSFNSRWKMPSYFHTTLFEMRDGGTVRLVVLDTSPFERSSYTDFKDKIVIDTVRQKTWMDSVFSLKDADWTIVSGHHPIYTGGLRVNDYNSVRNSLLPIFAKFELPVYFAGHEHDLQHLKNPAFPTHQFVSGAGSELRPTGSISYTKFAASIQGFMSVEVTRHTMDVYVISYQLDTLYNTQLGR